VYIATKAQGHEEAQSRQHTALTDLVELRVFVPWWRDVFFLPSARNRPSQNVFA